MEHAAVAERGRARLSREAGREGRRVLRGRRRALLEWAHEWRGAA